MSLSIRNQLPGTVTSVTAGEAMSTVKVRLQGGQDITAAITTDAVKALVKPTEVSLATGLSRASPSVTSSRAPSPTWRRVVPWVP